MRRGFAQRNKTEKLTVTALLTALFAVVVLAFKGFVIIPSITELRPVNAFPLIFGLLLLLGFLYSFSSTIPMESVSWRFWYPWVFWQQRCC